MSTVFDLPIEEEGLAGLHDELADYGKMFEYGIDSTGSDRYKDTLNRIEKIVVELKRRLTA